MVILLAYMKYLDYFSALFQSGENMDANGTSKESQFPRLTLLDISVLNLMALMQAGQF